MACRVEWPQLRLLQPLRPDQVSDSPIITKHNNYSPITKYKDDKSQILKSPKHQFGEVPTSSPFTFSGDSTTSQLPGLAGTTVETLVFGLSASGLSPGQVVFVETCHIFPPQAPDSKTSFASILSILFGAESEEEL